MASFEETLESCQGVRLLYVEDNDDAREATLMIFEEFFDTIITAVDGEEGLQKFRDNPIDLVISDVSMPKMDGLAMIREIKKINPNTYTIINTALNETATIEEAHASGVDDLLAKPSSGIEALCDLFFKASQAIKQNND